MLSGFLDVGHFDHINKVGSPAARSRKYNYKLESIFTFIKLKNRNTIIDAVGLIRFNFYNLKFLVVIYSYCLQYQAMHAAHVYLIVWISQHADSICFTVSLGLLSLLKWIF